MMHSLFIKKRVFFVIAFIFFCSFISKKRLNDNNQSTEDLTNCSTEDITIDVFLRPEGYLTRAGELQRWSFYDEGVGYLRNTRPKWTKKTQKVLTDSIRSSVYELGEKISKKYNKFNLGCRRKFWLKSTNITIHISCGFSLIFQKRLYTCYDAQLKRMFSKLESITKRLNKIPDFSAWNHNIEKKSCDCRDFKWIKEF